MLQLAVKEGQAREMERETKGLVSLVPVLLLPPALLQEAEVLSFPSFIHSCFEGARFAHPG